MLLQPKKRATDDYHVTISPCSVNLGLIDPVTKQPLSTPMWGLGSSSTDPTYPCPTIIADYYDVKIKWDNQLVYASGKPMPHMLPVDTTVNWANPKGYPKSGVPITIHVHGALTGPQSSGYPLSWYTPNYKVTGSFYEQKTNTYSAQQEAATLWYHDQTLGMARLNTYAGICGLYLIYDSNEDYLVQHDNLPGEDYDIPLIIEDRLFYTDGRMYYPSNPAKSYYPNPTVETNFFGTIILVNGMAWPYLDVEPRKYRLRIVNASDSRFYWYSFSKQGSSEVLSFYATGTDQGFRNAPDQLSDVIIGPGERSEIVIDFAQYEGDTIIMHNTAQAPFPHGTKPDGNTGQIMAFKVTKKFNPMYPKVTLPSSLRKTPLPTLYSKKPPRQLVIMNDDLDRYSRPFPMLGTTDDGAMIWEMPISEKPTVGTTETWELFNFTTEAVPIHVSGVRFQIVNRQEFTATIDQNDEMPIVRDINMVGDPTPPKIYEQGWKDTVVVYPTSAKNTGNLTRIIMTFKNEGQYLWSTTNRCKQDYQMIRPYVVESKK